MSERTGRAVLDSSLTGYTSKRGSSTVVTVPVDPTQLGTGPLRNGKLLLRAQ